MSAAKKVISVVGATGNQGGALIRAIVKDGTFTARAITRDVNSKAAQALKKMGAEVAQADIYSPKTLTQAIEGSHGLFCVTVLDLHKPDKEIDQAKSMAEAAQNTGIKHVVWSTLEDVRKFVPLSDNSMPTLLGKYKVPHFDVKGEADQYFAKLPTTYLLTSFFWDNFFMPGACINKAPFGKLILTIPMGNKPMPGIASEDIGKCSLGVFKQPGEYVGKRVGIQGESVTGADMAAKVSKVFGKNVSYYAIPYFMFRRFPFPGAAEFSNMYQFYHDHNDAFCKARSGPASKQLNPGVMDFEQFLVKNKERIALPA